MVDKQKIIYVKGDVSGIQDFIFNVKSDGAAQELKGRSFFIKLLIEVAMRYLLDHFDVKGSAEIEQSKISTSGGNFIIKLPAVKEYETEITKARQVFTNALKFTGLNISIAFIEQSGDYKSDIKRLDSKCREAKYRFYQDSYEYFSPLEKKKIADLSNKWANFTSLIKTNKTFSINNVESKSDDLIITDKFVEIAGYKITFQNDVTGCLLDTHLESLFPEKQHQATKDFKDLSESDFIDKRVCQLKEIKGGESGLNKLGILVLDVDGLGLKMESVTNEKEHSELDTSLRKFFNHRLRELINDVNIVYRVRCKDGNNLSVPKFENKIYSVTAGGDDSFFVGKWNTILDFAIQVNTEFRLNFPELTISAGLIMVDPKFPVIRFADLVENALKKAKYQYESKGNICLFGEVIKWEMLKEIFEMRKQLGQKNITGGMLAKARLSANTISNFDAFKLEDFWKMGYYLRDLDEQSKSSILNKIDSNISKSIEEKDLQKKQNYRKILPLAARLAELDKR